MGFSHCRLNAVKGQTALARVERPSGGVASVSVEFDQVAGTAAPGDDYALAANPLRSGPPGGSFARLIEVSITADGQVESMERFRLTLTNPRAAALMPFAQLDVEILDDIGDTRFRKGVEGPTRLP